MLLVALGITDYPFFQHAFCFNNPKPTHENDIDTNKEIFAPGKMNIVNLYLCYFINPF